MFHEASTNTPCVTCGRSDSETKVVTKENCDDENCVRSFSRFPQKDPIHLSFEKITYTAKLGFRKGTENI